MSDRPEAPVPQAGELHLFEGYGVEIEYMIVSRESLDVAPVSDKLLHKIAGAYESEVERGPLAWSNELVLHVLEMKTNGPAKRLEALPQLFQKDVVEANGLLASLGAMLLPTAMHPWMDPDREMRLWPHEYNAVYETFNRIFGCRGHGWANLQSVHLNLPFSGNEEFGQLHAAIRLVLPLIPALAASSPLMDGKFTGKVDNRLAVYQTHVQQVPAMMGDVIPEPVYRKADYERRILDYIYEELAPYDPEGILRHEWANARGAIARFDRSAIEIRLVDVQECPAADLAIAALLSAVIRALISEQWTSFDEQCAWPSRVLEGVLEETTRTGEETVIRNPLYLECFGLRESGGCTAGELWRHLLEDITAMGTALPRDLREPLEIILKEGTLARRIIRAAGGDTSRESLRTVYRELAACLAVGRMFRG